MNRNLSPNLIVAVSRPDSVVTDGSKRHDSLNEEDQSMDSYDQYNHPRKRRCLILASLERKYPNISTIVSPRKPADDLSIYELVHDEKMIEFLSSAWDKWVKLGRDGRDESNFHPSYKPKTDGCDLVPPMVPCHVPLHRDRNQKASANVMGQVGFFCTDNVTPIVSSLAEELAWDAAVVQMAVEKALNSTSVSSGEKRPNQVAYAITTHPGHHASYDSMGGYCYLNHAALAARLVQQTIDDVPQTNLCAAPKDDGGHRRAKTKVAVLDVDYHCGNGTSSIFYDDPSVLVVSIHCDCDYEYPFNHGFADQVGSGNGKGFTRHIPLPPRTTWDQGYKEALSLAMRVIVEDFETDALVVSLGLDTHEGDAVATRRAGFRLCGKDYLSMGSLIGANAAGIPTVVIQEGGYDMDVVGDAAADVVAGLASRPD